MSRTEYVWHEPERSISVHLPLDVVSRLGLDAMEAYKAVPKRGLEIGGLLLGRADGNTIYISDFQPVESEHRWGPAYRLSETDLQALTEAVNRHPDAVGLYRTSTSQGPFHLEDEDVNLFRQHFGGPGNVYLLLQPAKGIATFFVSEGETLAAGHEFPFRASDLPAEVVETEPEIKPVVAAAPPPLIEANQPSAAQPSRKRTRLVQAAALLFGMVAGAATYQAFHIAASRAADRSKVLPVNATPRTAAPAGIVPVRVPLGVKREDSSLMLYWNPDNPAVQKADKGFLYISDGNQQQKLSLDQDDLKSGVISYRPRSADVTFHLQVFDTAGHTTEDSIRVIGGAGPAPRKSAKPVQDAAAPPPQPERSVQGTAARVEEPPQAVPEPAEVRPSPFTSNPKPTAAAAPPADPHPPLAVPPPTRSPEPRVTVRAEPVSGTRLGHMMGHIPLLRKLRKSPQSFVPPVPIREVRPTLTARERRALTGDIPIDIRVRVGKSGKVEDVEMLGHAERQPLFADIALSAARRWEFTPARVGQEKAPSEVILHFLFEVEGPPPAQSR